MVLVPIRAANCWTDLPQRFPGFSRSGNDCDEAEPLKADSVKCKGFRMVLVPIRVANCWTDLRQRFPGFSRSGNDCSKADSPKPDSVNYKERTQTK